MFPLIICFGLFSSITVDVVQCQNLDTDLTQILNETTATNEIATSEEKELQCSEGYLLDLSTSRCYKLHREMKVWEQAEAACIAEGGHLAVIDDETESQALSKMNLAKNYPYTHIGLRDITPADEDVEGDWRSVHGTRVEELFNVWDEGSKPTFDFHKCAVVLHTGLLDNYLCDIERDFLCEKDPVHA